jgi:hypothetical protein
VYRPVRFIRERNKVRFRCTEVARNEARKDPSSVVLHSRKPGEKSLGLMLITNGIAPSNIWALVSASFQEQFSKVKAFVDLLFGIQLLFFGIQLLFLNENLLGGLMCSQSKHTGMVACIHIFCRRQEQRSCHIFCRRQS